MKNERNNMFLSNQILNLYNQIKVLSECEIPFLLRRAEMMKEEFNRLKQVAIKKQKEKL